MSRRKTEIEREARKKAKRLVNDEFDEERKCIAEFESDAMWNLEWLAYEHVAEGHKVSMHTVGPVVLFLCKECDSDGEYLSALIEHTKTCDGVDESGVGCFLGDSDSSH